MSTFKGYRFDLYKATMIAVNYQFVGISRHIFNSLLKFLAPSTQKKYHIEVLSTLHRINLMERYNILNEMRMEMNDIAMSDNFEVLLVSPVIFQVPPLPEIQKNNLLRNVLTIFSLFLQMLGNTHDPSWALLSLSALQILCASVKSEVMKFKS